MRKTIDKKLRKFVHDVDKLYSLNKISPLLSKQIKNYALRKGKRLRPILFITSYLGFAKKPAANLYTSALSLELLHDFLIIHDDIIDKSDIRRGKPSMHKMLNNYLSKNLDAKFSGEDLSIVVGDIMYAMAIQAFLSIKEKGENKEKALKKIVEGAIYTGTGEFVELMYATKPIKALTKQGIYRIYDLKTANYSFSSPLCAGAILGGASQSQIDKLSRYGIYMGRAFQIKDDILGMFGEEHEIGKSSLTDLCESKKTILIWYAYNNSTKQNKTTIKKLLSKDNVVRSDLLKMRKIISESGALDYAKKEISHFLKKSEKLSTAFKMRPKQKNFLQTYLAKLLSISTKN